MHFREDDAVVWPVLRKDGRYNINTCDGAVTTRQTLVAARAFCELATLDPSLLVKKSKPDAPPSRRQSRHVPHQLPPAKPRARYGSLVDHTKKKQKIVQDSFAAVVDHLDQNPHQKKTVLGSLALAAAKDGKVLQDEHEQLQLAFDSAKRKILGMAVFDPSGVANSKAIETALGDGYAAEQERTFRRHRHCLMSKLRDICGDDTRRHLQLLQGCLETFANEKKLSPQDIAAKQVLQGISETLEKIKILHGGKGRTPHDLKVAQETLQAAALSKVDQPQAECIKAMLSTSNKHQLLAAHQRGQDFLHSGSGNLSSGSGNPKLPYNKEEASCNEMDPVWSAKVSAMWLSGTRPSENKKDELKNPKDRSDPRTYRTRFLEMGLEPMLNWMNETGRREVCPEFSVGRRFMTSLRPFFIKRPGREYSLCRYHMEWTNLCHALKSWSSRSLTNNCHHVAVTADEHGLRNMLMCAKAEEFEGRYYQISCANRTCPACADSLSKLTCAECRDKIPNISWLRWEAVPYTCADGREVTSNDFVKVTTSIQVFLEAFKACMGTFFGHHDRAKWQDDDWGVAWNDPTLFGKELSSQQGFVIAAVEDFSQSYTHRPKREHAGRFFHSISTTIYGCCLRIPLAACKASFIPDAERHKLVKLLDKNLLPHVLTICTFGISADQGHDTAFVQKYHEDKLYPWLAQNCHPIHTYLMRSDGCTGQFKCGRHFRWLSTHSSKESAGGIKLCHSHSESCHGKDISDPECGRLKYMLEEREMEHTLDTPTQMDTSAECFEYMQDAMQPKRSLYDKKGVGVFKRVFFFMGAKDVKHNLAECSSVPGSSKFHEFRDIGREGFLNCRVLSCHRCIHCQNLRPQDCLNLHRTGDQLLRQVTLKSGGAVVVPLLRSSVGISGKANAALVKIGAIFSVELDSTQEPWMLAKATSELYKYDGASKETWMGRIDPGDMIINVVKLEPTAAGANSFTDAADNEMAVFDTDVRVIDLVLAETVLRSSARNPRVHKRYVLSTAQRDMLNDAAAVVDGI